MKSYKANVAFLAATLLCLLCVSARAQTGPAVIVQTSGTHSFRLRYSNVPIDEYAEPENPAFVSRKWDRAIPLLKDGKIKSATINGLNISVQVNPLTISIKGAKGKQLQQFVIDEITGKVSFLINGGPIMGLGEGSEKMDKRGAFYSMKQGQVYPNPEKWIATVPVPLLIGADGWAFFIATPNGQFDLTGKTGLFIPGKNNTNTSFDLIFFDASKPTDLMHEIANLFGKPAMPPKWALGYMQSHRTLQNSQQMLGLVDTFRQKKLPVDAVIYLGTGFTPRGWNKGHNSLDFNPAVFNIPPQTFINEMHKRSTKVLLHVVPPTIGGKLQLHGAIPAASGEVVDSTSISRYWQKHKPTFAMGVDGWWPDEGDAYTTKSLFLRSEMYYKGPLTDRPNERPWNLQRNGYLGVARYGTYIWSGDVKSDWETLAAQIGVGLNYSLSVSPFWGTDTGGFIPTPELTGELYLRWFQFSAFCASFRSHGKTWHLRVPWGWGTGDFGIIEDPLKNLPPVSELNNPDIEKYCREVLNLRYSLLPYNYTTVREAYDEGMPMMRPLWLYYPQDTTAIKQTGEYLWGKNLLVAPVTEKGALIKQVYLPKGEWYNWWTNKKISGRQIITADANLATIPLFVKAGSIIPVDPVRQYVDEPVKGPTTIRVYRGADGHFTLYDDDGNTQKYLKGDGNWTDFTWNEKSKSLTIKPSGNKHTVSRKFKLRFIPGDMDRQVNYTGQRIQVNL